MMREREHIQSSEPTTQSLNGVAFQLYLQRHNISPLEVALTAGMRYMSVWRIMRGLPVRREDEMLARQGLFRLTGEWYAGPILARTDPPKRKD